MFFERKIQLFLMIERISNLYRKLVSSSFFKKVVETYLTRLVVTGLGLIAGIILARVLGPEGRGIYAVAVVIGAVGVQFGNFGLHSANTYYVTRDKKLLPSLLGNVLFVIFVGGFGGAGIAWLVFWLWPNLVPIHGFFLILVLAWIPFGLAYMFFQNLLLGVHEVRFFNKTEFLNSFLGVVFFAILIFMGEARAETFFGAVFLALIISSVVMFGKLSKHLKKAPWPSFKVFKLTFGYALKSYLAGFFIFLVLRVDLLMVSYMLGEKETGYYAISVSMADLVYMIPLMVGTILFPKASAIKNVIEKWQLTKKVLGVLSGVMVVVCGLAILLASPLVQLLFGEAFLPAVPAFIWLLPAIFLLAVGSTLGYFISAVDIPLVVVPYTLMVAILNIVLNLFFIKEFGIVGAAISSVISYGAMIPFNVYLVRLYLRRARKAEI